MAEIRIAVNKLAKDVELGKNKGGGGEPRPWEPEIAKARDGGDELYFPEKVDTPSFECP